MKVCVLVGYDPNEGNGEERERFRNDLDRIVDREGNAYRLCMLGDLKRWNVDRMKLQVLFCLRLVFRVFHVYIGDTMTCREKERSKIRAFQMYSVRSLLGIRRMGRVPNAQNRET